MTLGSPLRRFIARNSTTRPIELTRQAVWRAAKLLQAENHDMQRNGERVMLERLAGAPRTLLDVGANTGDWTAMALAQCPHAVVHAFEISTSTRALLRERFRLCPRVYVADHGILDVEGRVAVKTYDRHMGWTSTVDYPHEESSRWVLENVMRGDDYLFARDLDSIDLLKIDAEGADLAVLESFMGAITNSRVAVIQFEYGYGGAVSGATLTRFRRLLEPHGYRLGRLRAKDIDWRLLNVTDEHFFGPNYVAVHQSARWACAALDVPR